VRDMCACIEPPSSYRAASILTPADQMSNLHRGFEVAADLLGMDGKCVSVSVSVSVSVWVGGWVGVGVWVTALSHTSQSLTLRLLSPSPCKRSARYSTKLLTRDSSKVISLFTHTHTHIYIYIYICTCTRTLFTRAESSDLLARFAR
jgi:hypothetical protein